MTAITSVHVQVALQKGSSAQPFLFSRTRLVSRVILHLSSGKMALRNISFPVCDNDLSSDDLLLRLSIPQRVQIDSRTVMEVNRSMIKD